MASCVEIKLHLAGAVPYFQLVNHGKNHGKPMENSIFSVGKLFCKWETTMEKLWKTPAAALFILVVL